MEINISTIVWSLSVSSAPAEIVNTAFVSYSLGSVADTATINVYAGYVKPGTEGTALSPDGKAELIVPANALPILAYVKVKEYSYSDPKVTEANQKAEGVPNIEPIPKGKSYDFVLHDTQGNLIGTLTGNVTMSISYPDADQDGYIDSTGIREECLQIFRLNEERKEWERLSGSQVDALTNLVSVQISHLSIFSLMADVISSVTHDATSPLRIGDVLTVRMEGQTEGTATFTIAGIATTTMREVSTGTYIGSYTVKQGDSITDGTLTGWLQIGTQTYSKDATATVTLKGIHRDLDNVIVYPNPCRGERITFLNLTDQCKISIYTIAGELVFEKEYTNTKGKVEWNLKNNSGKGVASGVYIYKITNNKKDKAFGKVGVIR